MYDAVMMLEGGDLIHVIDKGRVCDAVMMWEGGDLIHVIDKGRVCMMQ